MVVNAATLRQKLKNELTISPSQKILAPGQPVPVWAPWRQMLSNVKNVSVSLGRLWSCALGVYSGTASGVAGQSDTGVTVPVAEDTEEV